MTRHWVLFVFLLVLLPTAVWGHDPRTTAKEVGVSLSIEGSGDLTIKYKGMHFNQPTYERMKSSAELRQLVNAGLWNNIGTAEVGFDVVIGTEALPKGTYQFGLNVDGDDQFSWVFRSGEITKTITLKVQPGVDVSYLTLAFTPTAAPDTFVLEGRCGRFHGTTLVKIPALQEHKH